MGIWDVTDPETGVTISVESDGEPTDEQLDQVFAQKKQEFLGESKAAMGTNPKAIKGNLLAAGTGLALGLPFAAPRRVAGAGYSGYQGYRAGSRVAGPVGGIVGGAGGAVAGAVSPAMGGVTTGAIEGLTEGSVPDAVLQAVVGAIAGGKGGEILKFVKGLKGAQAVGGEAPAVVKGAEQLASEVAAARTAERVSKILPKGQRAMPTNLGGIAKPGPPPTPPDQIEAALRASIEANAAKGAPSGLAAERLRVGAEKAAGRKGPLMTALAREEAGPVLGEMRGTASPVLPEKAIAEIAAAIRKLPRGGPERLAYVKRATSGKAMATAETIRRTLESMGLLVPVGLAAGMEE